ncbi:MAG: hypothetical protein FJ025_04685 [Chloroflexi bacterium]|nr:hypothetical protein [Chloroflexota bacterium]
MESQEVKIRIGDLRIILATRRDLLKVTEGLDANEVVRVKVLSRQVRVKVDSTGERLVVNI